MMTNEAYKNTIIDLLKRTVEKQASDLHLIAGFSPAMRINGKIKSTEYAPLTPDDVDGLVKSILTHEQIEKLNSELELDFSYALSGIARFRGNIMKQRGTLAAAFRAVPFTMPGFEQLGLPDEIKKLCDLSRGLVLVTGPTGSGKSTTLASLIDIINTNRALNIVTIEDPIEFLHKHKKSTVRQREIGMDTHSFSSALRHVLRHDPDVILIGEMRDLDSVSIALTAAETGHLVFSTLHTQTAPLTISRIVDIFSDDRREQVRQQLAGSLKAVISQQLLPRADGSGRVVAVEYMVDTPAVRNLIREGKEHQLYSTIQMGHSYGMQTMDSALVKLYQSGKITKEVVLEYCIDHAEVQRMIRNWV